MKKYVGILMLAALIGFSGVSMVAESAPAPSASSASHTKAEKPHKKGWLKMPSLKKHSKNKRAHAESKKK